MIVPNLLLPSNPQGGLSSESPPWTPESCVFLLICVIFTCLKKPDFILCPTVINGTFE